MSRLPELPESTHHYFDSGLETWITSGGYSDDQMRAYAQKAIDDWRKVCLESLDEQKQRIVDMIGVVLSAWESIPVTDRIGRHGFVADFIHDQLSVVGLSKKHQES